VRTRLLVQTTLWLAAMGVLLFGPAGAWRWPQAWVFLAEQGLGGLAVGFWLLRHDPALLATRFAAPLRRDQPRWDRLFLLAVAAAFIAWLGLIGLDARRLAWSRLPLWGEVLGGVLIALGLLVVWETFRYNSFAAPQVRLQAERGHRVVSDGPYRLVRHPMYAGAILWLVGTPLLLGSWWGVAAVPLLVGGVAARIVGEERMLCAALPGYQAYARRVRFRLIPGVW
jgi:protein-S-isoprenylcysteine O-methyltransferase Ste14